MKSSSNKVNPSDDDVARMVAAAAGQELRGSERGSQALVDFSNLLENGGYSLDTENWRALSDLCRLGVAGKVFALDELVSTLRRG